MTKWIWQWECHGFIWQLIPAWRYPERDDFDPVCPECGNNPPRKWIEVAPEAFDFVSKLGKK